VQGVDVWMNTPRRPLEASGTSGMKAAVNGALNCSVLDGWWVEGYGMDTGWAIGDGEVYADPEEQDRVECEALFNLLEHELVPLYYERDRNGMPRQWIAMMKAAIRNLGAMFNTHRMVREYAEHAYLPGHRAGKRWRGGDATGVKELAAWRQRLTAAWQGISLRVDDWDEREAPVGSTVDVTVRVRLGTLAPGDVAVEVVSGPMDPGGGIRSGHAVVADFRGIEAGEHVFQAAVPCGTTGRFGCAARVRPRHGDLQNPWTPLLLTWE
jgi:starch phosphorylase